MCGTTHRELVGAYLHPSAWSWSFRFAGSCPWILIPSVATALFRIEPIASTDSFSRTSTLHLLSRAAFTWKDGFSVVAPIRVTVPHSTWGRKVSCRRKRRMKTEARQKLKQKREKVNIRYAVRTHIFIQVKCNCAGRRKNIIKYNLLTGLQQVDKDTKIFVHFHITYFTVRIWWLKLRLQHSQKHNFLL